MKKVILRGGVLAMSIAISAVVSSATGITYTCDANIDAAVAGTCNTLNTSIAGLYGNTFNDANASIYIQYGNTGLGSSLQYLNFVTYGTYRAALAADASGNVVDTGALASLPQNEPALYSNSDVEITSALAKALGITTQDGGGSITGTTAGGAACNTPGSGGCYNAVITLATPAIVAGYGQAYYYRHGAQAANAYDIYSIVEHETDEVLGTSSCVSTGGGSLSDGCGGSSPSAVDLFRYNASGNHVLIDSTPGAYFSYDGGVTHVGSPYNTLANGDDYADFSTNCKYVQDATGCTGQSFDITTDGLGGTLGPETTILDAVGYNLNPPTSPEPASIGLFGSGVVLIAGLAYRRRKQAA